MNVQEWFLMSHAHVHKREGQLCQPLSEEQLRHCPSEHSNSVAWLLWHMARCEDVMVNTVLRNVPEVLDQEGWLARLNVTTRHIGTDDSREEMESFSCQVDVAALRAYWAAVGRETRDWAAHFAFDRLDEQIGTENVQRAHDLGAFGPRAGWVQSLWASGTRGLFLSWLTIGHNHSHIGEAWVTRNLLHG